MSEGRSRPAPPRRTRIAACAVTSSCSMPVGEGAASTAPIQHSTAACRSWRGKATGAGWAAGCRYSHPGRRRTLSCKAVHRVSSSAFRSKARAGAGAASASARLSSRSWGRTESPCAALSASASRAGSSECMGLAPPFRLQPSLRSLRRTMVGKYCHGRKNHNFFEKFALKE